MESMGYTVYFVESGLLKFQLLPRQRGFHLEHPAPCVSASGEFSSGGTNSVDDQGWMHVDAGTAVISEEIPIEQIGDQLVTDRGERERQRQRPDCRKATPAR